VAQAQQQDLTPNQLRRRKRAVAAFADMINKPAERKKLTPKTYKKIVTTWLKPLELKYNDIPPEVHTFFKGLTQAELSGLAKLQHFMTTEKVKGLYENIPKSNPPPGTLAKL
jgi:hypothetical protein